MVILAKRETQPILEVSFEDDYQELTEYTELQKAVVPLFKESADGWEGLGTAFCIGHDGLFVTARHVLLPDFEAFKRGECEIKALFETDTKVTKNGREMDLGAWLHVTDVVSTVATDIALIRTRPLVLGGETLPLPVVSITSQLTVPEDICAAIGYPHIEAEVASDAPNMNLERTLAVSRGTVRNVHPELLDRGLFFYPTFELGARLSHGMSGGPIVSTMTEGVFGMISGGLPIEEGAPPVAFGSLLGPLMHFEVPGTDATVGALIEDGYISAHESDLRYDFFLDEDKDEYRIRLRD